MSDVLFVSDGSGVAFKYELFNIGLELEVKDNVIKSLRWIYIVMNPREEQFLEIRMREI